MKIDPYFRSVVVAAISNLVEQGFRVIDPDGTDVTELMREGSALEADITTRQLAILASRARESE